ncbi:hypothetical protein CK203_049461 [Vitis vinifera]|uniref:Uncharacterized protein n=1 Tax=Vitis vinifera TaxID=29760 RepID=A0A438HB11_VITVI|nr:hypothetical protein CK203_049461 [Vitis vinifera]
MVHILSRGTSTRSYLLRKELPPSMFLLDALLHHNLFPLQHMVQRRGALLEALFQISEGFFFDPHHLIMTGLLYFEEKVHRKKILKADVIPLLFPRCICREIFTLDKWTSMMAYDAQPGAPTGPEHPEIAQPKDPQTLPVVPATSKPHPSKSRIAISILEFKDLCILSSPEHDMLGPLEPIDPSQDAPPAEQTVSPKETTTEQIETSIRSLRLL